MYISRNKSRNSFFAAASVVKIAGWDGAVSPTWLDGGAVELIPTACGRLGDTDVLAGRLDCSNPCGTGVAETVADPRATGFAGTCDEEVSVTT